MPAINHLIKEIRNEIEHISPKHLTITKKTYATKKEVHDFEKRSGLVFPEDLTDFWLHCDFEISAGTKIYKDLDCEDGPSYFLFDDFEYMVSYWEENSGHSINQEFKEGSYYDFKDRGFKEKILIESFFDKNWFPVAIDSYDGALCVDLNPGPDGTYGQLLYMMYVGDSKSGPYYSGYTSITAFLQDYLQLLKDRNTDIEEDIIYPLTHF